MASSITRKADFTIINIDGEFSVFSIAEDFQTFASVLAEVTDNIVVELSQVCEMDTSAVQLLMWLKKKCGEHCQVSIDVCTGSRAEQLLQLYSLKETQLGKLISTPPEKIQ